MSGEGLFQLNTGKREISEKVRDITKQFLITEVTHEHKLAWEYISPYYGMENLGNFVYRAYRVPYEWVRHSDTSKEPPVEPVDVSRFRVHGTEWKPDGDVIEVNVTLSYKSLTSSLHRSKKWKGDNVDTADMPEAVNTHLC